MRLYTNENFPLPAAQILRTLGHDVQTIQEVGYAGQAQSDQEVLAHAVKEGRILVTLNRRHFIALHSANPEHAGIIVCSFDPDFDHLAHRIHAFLQKNSSWTGHLERVNR